MSGSPSEARPPVGLRERKKIRTRAAIQHEALRLFRTQGYDETTVEQIAEASEVSSSTLFRYFPSKEDLVLTDDYDPVIIEACRAQPPEVPPVEAVRRGLRTVFESMDDRDLGDMRHRAELAVKVPELRAAMLDQFAQVIGQLTDVVAERAGRPTDDLAVTALTGAILGVMISVEFYWVEHPGSDLVALIDGALSNLEAGLPL